MLEVPGTAFSGYLKSLRWNGLTQTHQFILSLTFADFDPSFVLPSLSMLQFDEDVLEAYPSVQERRSLVEDPRDARRIIMDRRRRFAGDHSVPKSRYYTLAHNAYGLDHACLIRELLAYYSSDVVGPITIGEFLNREEAQSIGLSPQRNAIALHYQQPSKRIQHRLKGNAIWLPYETRYENFKNVFDLRRTEAQEWLVALLKDTKRLARELKIQESSISEEWLAPRTIAELLPHLVTPQQGGTDLTDLIGLFLRKTGVEALIYPSARSKSGAWFEDGKLEGWTGFNLLDYRDAWQTKVKYKKMISSPWNATEKDHIDVEWNDEGTRLVYMAAPPDLKPWEYVSFLGQGLELGQPWDSPGTIGEDTLYTTADATFSNILGAEFTEKSGKWIQLLVPVIANASRGDEDALNKFEDLLSDFDEEPGFKEGLLRLRNGVNNLRDLFTDIELNNAYALLLTQVFLQLRGYKRSEN